MNKQKNLRNISTKEDLIAFLQAVYHEDEPNLYLCKWEPQNENEVFLWYKGHCKSVSGKVVKVLRSLPPQTKPSSMPSLLQRIAAFFK